MQDRNSKKKNVNVMNFLSQLERILDVKLIPLHKTLKSIESRITNIEAAVHNR